jgi:hypothetical protein
MLYFSVVPKIPSSTENFPIDTQCKCGKPSADKVARCLHDWRARNLDALRNYKMKQVIPDSQFITP